MKPLLPCVVFFCALIPNSALSNPSDLLPPYRLENRTATDGSIVQCLVADFSHGLNYEFEISEDLVTWETRTSLYGLGQSFAFPLRTFASPPPPDPGSPVPPAPAVITRNVSLLLTPSPSGGTLVSWISHEDETPIIVALDTPMDPAWSSMPVYWQTFGNFGLFIVHPPVVLPEPAENPTLTGTDAELLATLEEHFDEMNTEVANSVALSRNTPPPAASSNSQRLFARIRVKQCDSDHDGSTDDAEFRLLLAPGGNPLANPYLADVDHNGVLDGDQLDLDQDGIPDQQDGLPASNAGAIQITVPPRFALFETTGQGMPIQISDKGTVLFQKGTWHGGKYRVLPGIGDARAMAINDNDTILGSIWRDISEGENTATLCSAVYWKSPTDPMKYVETAGDVKTYAEGPAFPLYGLPVLSNDGSFAGAAMKFDDDGYWVTSGANPTLNTWTVSGSNGACFPSRRVPDEPNVDIAFGSGPNLMWGQEAIGDDDAAGVVYTPAKLPHLRYRPQNVIRLNSGNQIRYLALHDGDSAQLSSGSDWTESGLYKPALDAAEDGTAIGLKHSDFIAPMLINGKWLELERVAPDLPVKWRDGTEALRDITAKGWTLAIRGNMLPDDGGYLMDDSAMETGVMLPIRIQGIPQENQRGYETGVDDFSITSSDPDLTHNRDNNMIEPHARPVRDRYWIMAPLGGGGTRVTFKAPLDKDTPLKLSAAGLTFDGAADITLSEPEKTFEVKATDPALAGQDIALDLQMGVTSSSSKPIGVKIMKRRVVTVRLHKVGNPNLLPADESGRETFRKNMEDYLNSVYQPQVNVTFSVSYGAEYTGNWDTNGNGTFDFNVEEGGEDDGMSHFTLQDPTPNIHLFLIDSPNLILDEGYGVAWPDSRCCWLLTTHRPGEHEASHPPLTAAHEIGHIMIGPGHPDEGQGPAPLPGTKHNQRLMVSRMDIIGDEDNGDPTVAGLRIVKGEWDRIEAWIQNEIRKLRMTP